MVQEALDLGFSVVIDATNFKRAKWDQYAKIYDAELVIQDFTNVTTEECIKRDNARAEPERVGSQVILRMYNQYLKKDE